MASDEGVRNMPQQPLGDPQPADGSLPESSDRALGRRPFGVYVHIPFCATRCGYCDFNTYTATELGPGIDRAGFAKHLAGEVSFARRVLGDTQVPVSSIFVGGGTPTLLPPAALGRVLDRIRAEFGVADGAEITVEANPESVDRERLAELLHLGVNRISFGMQSASPEVLRVLERGHSPDGALRAVAQAAEAGFERISLDLIYGTPGESLAAWSRTLDSALAAGVPHISAYALIVEQGTRLAAAVRRGEIPAPDDDLMADMYEMADSRFRSSGLDWYEISNWARADAECRHNLSYWAGDDWWGIGPGAHSHIAGTRWWNVKHPATYLQRLAAGISPGAAREVLDQETRRAEAIMLGIRLARGLPTELLSPSSLVTVSELEEQGLVAVSASRVVLTLRGRLLADSVVRRLS
jgi:putative oxygen-independent coproporphyrinogen III oxidase